MSTVDSQVDGFVDRVRRLYSLPNVALEVLRLTGQPDVDLHALRRTIENDPALTAKVLRVVNSSLFGLSCHVSDLHQAIALLGIKPLKLLVLGFTLSGELFADARGAVVSRYWRHTLTQAIAARRLAEKVWRLSGDEAFTAGLLKDIGMLVLIQELGEPYARLVERVLVARGDLAALEMAALGFDHVQLSAGLLSRWGLPDVLVEAIGSDSWPSATLPAARALRQVVDMAGWLADMLVDQRHDRLGQLLEAFAEQHQLSAEWLDSLVSDLQAEVGELADVFSLALPEGVDYRDVLIAAHEQLSEAAAEMASALLAVQRQDAELSQAAAVWEEVQGLATAVGKAARGHAPLPERTPNPPVAKKLDDASAAKAGRHAEVGLRFESLSKTEGSHSAVAVGSELDLRGQLLTAVAVCRQNRCALSLILVEVDRFSELVLAVGPVEAVKVVEQLGRLALRLDDAKKQCMQVGESRFAIILAGCDRTQAVHLADEMVRRASVAIKVEAHLPREFSLSVSAGVATVPSPSKNFWPAHLTERAARCLRAAQSSGGGTVKSIGIY